MKMQEKDQRRLNNQSNSNGGEQNKDNVRVTGIDGGSWGGFEQMALNIWCIVV